MTTEYKGVPDGASAIIPRLVCRDVEAEIDFCCQTFGAVEGVRRLGPDGKVAHAMLRFGPAMLMLEAEWPTLPSRAPNVDGSSPVVIYVYVAELTPQSAARWLAGRRSSYRWRRNSGVIAWGGCATQRATCGRSRRASKKRRRISGASDGPVPWKRRTDEFDAWKPP